MDGLDGSLGLVEYRAPYGANKNDRPGDDGKLRRVIFGSIVKNHRIIIIIIIIIIPTQLAGEGSKRDST